MGYAYDTDQTQLCSPKSKLIRTHSRDTDITLSGRTVNRCGAPRGGLPWILWGNPCCQPEFTKKWLAADGLRCQRVFSLVHGCPSQDWYSLRSGWLQPGFVVSGYSLLCTDVRPRVGIHSGVLVEEGWITRARGCSGISLGGVPVLSSVLLDASYRDIKARRCQMRATVAF